MYTQRKESGAVPAFVYFLLICETASGLSMERVFNFPLQLFLGTFFVPINI
jgi:hypothetical protein